uniref:C2H2-type domain-containing protein n=1 Tax=Oryza barthii TaxID=65489 RepID=A0A0D3HW27_9ORYZ
MAEQFCTIESSSFPEQPGVPHLFCFLFSTRIVETRSKKHPDMAPRGKPWKHCCNKCDKSFRSGNALGGHMSCHRSVGNQPKSTSSPPTVVDLHMPLLSSCDDNLLLLPPETQCQMCSKVFSTSGSLREHMMMHGGEKVVVKAEEEAAGLIEALGIADSVQDVMVFSSVKRKRSFRSKRQTPALSLEEIEAADALLLLSGCFDKTSAYEDCYLGDIEDSSLRSIVLTEVNMNAVDRCSVRSVGSKEPINDNNSGYKDCYGQSDKENCLIVPKEEMDPNDFDHELVRDAALRKPRTDNSDEEMKFGDLPAAAMKDNSHRCNTCGKSFGSGQALGGHMRRHYVRKCNRQRGVADRTGSVLMKVQKLKLRLDPILFDVTLPALTDGDCCISVGVKPEPQLCQY